MCMFQEGSCSQQPPNTQRAYRKRPRHDPRGVKAHLIRDDDQLLLKAKQIKGYRAFRVFHFRNRNYDFG